MAKPAGDNPGAAAPGRYPPREVAMQAMLHVITSNDSMQHPDHVLRAAAFVKEKAL